MFIRIRLNKFRINPTYLCNMFKFDRCVSHYFGYISRWIFVSLRLVRSWSKISEQLFPKNNIEISVSILTSKPKAPNKAKMNAVSESKCDFLKKSSESRMKTKFDSVFVDSLNFYIEKICLNYIF